MLCSREEPPEPDNGPHSGVLGVFLLQHKNIPLEIPLDFTSPVSLLLVPGWLFLPAGNPTITPKTLIS